MFPELSQTEFDGSFVTAIMGGVVLFSRATFPDVPECQCLIVADSTNKDAMAQHLFAVPHGMAVPKFLETDALYRFAIDASKATKGKPRGRIQNVYIWPLLAPPELAR